MPEDGYTCQSILAHRMAEKFYDIPIAVTVLDDKVYGAYIGNWQPYELNSYQPMVATLAFEMGLFKSERDGEVNGVAVTWWMNKRA